MSLKNKTKNILMGVLLFIGCLFTSLLNVEANSVSVTSKSYSNKQFHITVQGGRNPNGGSFKLQSVDISCKHTDGTQKYIGHKYFTNTPTSASTSWSVSGWKVGTWNCWLYADLVEDPWANNRADFSIWKSTFPTCNDVNGYSGSDRKAQCTSKVADNGDACMWEDGLCVKKTSSSSSSSSSSSKTGNTCGKTDYGTWTKTSCNDKVVSGKCHLWDASKSCCNVTSGSCSGSSSGGSSSGGSSSGGSSSGGSSSSSSTTTTKTTTTAAPYNDETECKKKGNYYYSGSKYTKGCYVLDQGNCSLFGFKWENGKCNTSGSSTSTNSTYNDEAECKKNGNLYKNGQCYKNDEDNCKILGYCWKNGKCDTSSTCENTTKVENTDEAKCKENGNIYKNGECYKNDEDNCKIFGYCWKDGKCDTSSKCSYMTLVKNGYNDESVCIANGNYYYSGDKYEKGCYILDKGNCSLFGFEWKDNKCNKTSSSSDTKYILFDQNFGYGLLCDDNVDSVKNKITSYYMDGVCRGLVSKGTTVPFPSTSNVMYREGEGYLLGWTKTTDNGKPVCTKDTIVPYSENVKVDSHLSYYACYKEVIEATRYALNDAVISGDKVKCGDALHITTCHKNSDGNGFCNFTSANNDTSIKGIVDRMKLASERPTSNACNTNSNETDKDSTIIVTEKKCSYSKQTIVNKGSFVMCYEKGDTEDEVIDKITSKVVKCGSGQKLDTSSIYGENDVVCNDNICKRTYNVKCNSNKVYRPFISVTAGKADTSGFGNIKVSAKSTKGNIEGYYVSEYYKVPTKNSNWIPVDRDNFSIKASSGTLYIWVIDSENNISNAVAGAVIDTINTDTVINKLELYDSNGNVKLPRSTTSYRDEGISSSDYVRLSNRLNTDSKIAEGGFNPYESEYKIDVESPTLAVYATLTSTDSDYVEGFGPRTVNLEYGINTILIKIKDKEGRIRTYTILATRTDDRTSDNTLSDLKVDVGSLVFNANVAEYKVEIPKDTKEVNVSSKIASDKASYVSGYEPGVVNITGDSTTKLIKVLSQTGSSRTYVITFVKEGTDRIEKDSLKLFSLKIPGVYLPFEESIANYNLSVGYETDTIDIFASLKDKDSTLLYRVKRKSDSEFKVGDKEGIRLDVGENFVEIKITDKDGEVSYYRLTIIRKEFGLDVSDDVTLKDLKVLGYDIKFSPNEKEYVVRIKQEKSLVITAVPASNRAEVFIRGNEELTGFSTVRVKVVAENGEFETYSIDIKKDAFNKTIEIIAIIAGSIIILGTSGIIVMKKKRKSRKDYVGE